MEHHGLLFHIMGRGGGGGKTQRGVGGMRIKREERWKKGGKRGLNHP